ncbi:hypothetical protein BGX34_000121 [Mortierella sp. NVP85]|nr:hypothetical protein BGX34_000121 [Mortierella sp. NVP85]
MARPEKWYPFQQQPEEHVGVTQRTGQQKDCTQQQQTQDPIEQILQALQLTDRQHIEIADRITQQLHLHRQQFEEVLQASHQQQRQYLEAVQQEIQQLDQDSRQQMQDIRQQAQQQLDNVITNVQKLDEQAQHSQQQHEQLLQQMRSNGEAKQGQDRLSPERRPQETQCAFNQFVHAQYRVQAALAKPSQKLPCGSHTTDKGSNKLHEVHLANHPGYDLNNQNQFISKYGPYLLTMMYMVKYGAKARGLVIPPLLGLNHAIGEGENICQLVNNTITHLEKAMGCIDVNAVTRQCLNATELTELKSHLRIKDGESFSGGLSQVEIQKAHYAWICKDHLRERYESTLQQLRCNVNDSGGVMSWHGNEVKVKVTSRTTTQLIFDDLSKLFRMQRVENWRSIAEIDLKRHNSHSASSSTANIISGLDDLESLSLDFGRFTMSAKGIFRDQIKDVIISIRDLSAPTLDDLEFIQQCRPATLSLLDTPQKKDDNCLVSLLQHNLSIATLRIECDMNRFMAVIDLVTSTRKVLQTENKPALQIFELIHPEFKVKMSFDEGIPALDIETCIEMKNCEAHSAAVACNFIRHYGWSVNTLIAPRSFSDRLMKLLDESIQERGSKIARLDITPTTLTTSGLDAMNQVINRSQGLTYLRLSLEDLNTESQMDKALRMLGRHKNRLSSLCLEGNNSEKWLPTIARSFPDKDGFPVLEEFVLSSRPMGWLSELDGQWIASMISVSSQQQSTLKVIGVTADIKPPEWEALFKAIDLPTLEELRLNSDYIYHDQIKFLVGCITDTSVSSLPMRVLDIKGKEIQDGDATWEMLARVQEKAPQLRVQCNDWTLEAAQ